MIVSTGFVEKQPIAFKENRIVRNKVTLILIIAVMIGILTTVSAAKIANEEVQRNKAYTDSRAGVDADYKHASPQAYEAWRDLKFGMRIHWGVYSVLGLDASWPAVPARGASKEFVDIYNTLYQLFNPTDFDADEWAKLAKRSGFKYVVFTARHHDGFAMYDTKTKTQATRRKPKAKVVGIGNIEP